MVVATAKYLDLHSFEMELCNVPHTHAGYIAVAKQLIPIFIYLLIKIIFTVDTDTQSQERRLCECTSCIDVIVDISID